MPYYQRINNWIHDNTSWKTFKHSCGAVESLIESFIESGYKVQLHEIATRLIQDTQASLWPAFAPEIRGLQRRHQHRDMPGADLFFVHDVFQLAQYLEAQRQPRIDPRARLPDHARAQHQAMARDLGIGGRFLENGQEVSAEAHLGLRS